MVKKFHKKNISSTLFEIYVTKALSHGKQCRGMEMQIDSDSCLYTLQFSDDRSYAPMTKRSRIHDTNIKRGISKMGSRNQYGENTISICKCEETKAMKLDNNGIITS